MTLPNPRLAYKGAGSGEAVGLGECRGLGFLFILNRIVKQHGRLSPSWALCDVVRFWGGRLRKEAARVVTGGILESEALPALLLVSRLISGKLLDLSGPRTCSAMKLRG